MIFQCSTRSTTILMKLILDVDDGKAKLLLAFLRTLTYVTVTTETRSSGQAQLRDEMKEAVAELKLVRAGKQKTRSLKRFLSEL